MTDEPSDNSDDTIPVERNPEDESGLMETRTDAKLPKVPGLRGRKLGGYTLLKELGHGGQGYVYLAEDEHLHRRVALKILPHAMSFSESARLRFEREAEVASKLDHPGICTVYETGEQDGIPFIAMQLIEGEALDRKIKSTKAAAAEDMTVSHVRFETKDESDTKDSASSSAPVTPRSRSEIMEVVRFIEDAARALHAAHEMGLIHRDIKPGNIMAGSDNRAVILDFGLARDETSHVETITQSGDLMGTPAYMAPEQIAANRIKLDRRADIYSLGATFYECLILHRPYEAETREALYQAIQFKDAVDPQSLNSAISKDLKVVLATAMEKDRDRRYQTALELAEELRRVRQYEPIQARPARPLLRLRRWTQRNPVVASLSAALLLFLVTGLIWTMTKNRQLAERTLEVERQSDLKSAALTEKNKALMAYDRLADVKKLQEAVTEAKDLWPARPRKVGAIEGWLEEYQELETNLRSHEDALGELRLRAIDYSNEDRDRDHADTIGSIGALEAEQSKLEAEEETTRSDNRRDEIEERLEAIPAEMATLREKLRKRRSWRFEGEEEDTLSWKHEVLWQLVVDLRSFLESDGVLADVKKRLAIAQSMRAKTVETYQEEWNSARARILVSDRYGKLVLKAQVGLIPLGPDPRSGLEEFVHFESHVGALPERVDGSFEVTGETGVILVLLPGGSFNMGAQKDDVAKPNHDPQARSEEGPVHEVTLAPFFLAKHELTRGQWVRISGKEDPSRWTEGGSGGRVKQEAYGRHPVETVSWNDCDRATQRSGLTLPTEAQWEYGCRGGTSTVWSFGGDMAEMKSYGNVADLAYAKAYGANAGAHEKGWDDGHGLTAPVGSFTANGFGLHDVHGNVWEWCRDWHGSYATDPVDLMTGMRQVQGSRHRVYRGGSFLNPSFYARAAYRLRSVPSYRNLNLGARPARATTP